jgi:hypothetical protein
MEDFLSSRKQIFFHLIKEWKATLVFWFVVLLVEIAMNVLK